MGTRTTAARTGAALTAMLAIAGAVTLAAAQPAAAIPGLQRVEAPAHQVHDEQHKSAQAVCPGNKHVIGGGAEINDRSRNVARLTGLVPLSNNGGAGPDAYAAFAESPQTGFDWNLTAYAICADRAYLDARGWEIEQHDLAVGTDGGPFAHTLARCDSGKVAHGSGGWVRGTGAPANGRLGLQMVRTSGPLDIARASAREENVNFAASWAVRAYAICARADEEIDIYADGVLQQGRLATTTCNGNTFVHGPGGGGGTVDGGPIWLNQIYPYRDLKRVRTATTATFPDGLINAHAVCAG